MLHKASEPYFRRKVEEFNKDPGWYSNPKNSKANQNANNRINWSRRLAVLHCNADGTRGELTAIPQTCDKDFAGNPLFPAALFLRETNSARLNEEAFVEGAAAVNAVQSAFTDEEWQDFTSNCWHPSLVPLLPAHILQLLHENPSWRILRSHEGLAQRAKECQETFVPILPYFAQMNEYLAPSPAPPSIRFINYGKYNKRYIGIYTHPGAGPLESDCFKPQDNVISLATLACLTIGRVAFNHMPEFCDDFHTSFDHHINDRIIGQLTRAGNYFWNTIVAQLDAGFYSEEIFQSEWKEGTKEKQFKGKEILMNKKKRKNTDCSKKSSKTKRVKTS